VQHIRRRLPYESLLYFSDSGYAPYGDKTEAEITERSLKIAAFLLAQNVKALVVACNTATAAAVAVLRQTYPHLTIIGIEPGLKPAAQISLSKVVGVLATKSTLESQKFQNLREQLSRDTQVKFISQACVGLVNQIENGLLDSPETMTLIQTYVPPLLEQGADTLVLGCTHYPFASKLIQQTIDAYFRQHKPNKLNPVIHLIDTGEAVAKHLANLLEQRALLNQSIPHSDIGLLHAWTSGKAGIVNQALHTIADVEACPATLAIQL
jgi:glutamate racemase